MNWIPFVFFMEGLWKSDFEQTDVIIQNIFYYSIMQKNDQNIKTNTFNI